MSQFIDYTYRFEGTQEDLALALGAISSFQQDNEEYSGNGNCDYDCKPDTHPDHLEWFFFTTAYGLVEDFNKKLTKLSKDSSLVVYAQWDTTDGQWASELNRIKNGKLQFIEGWNASIGLNTALAILRYRKKPVLDDLEILRERFSTAISDGWEEDDWAWLMTAAEIAREIFRGLSLAPDFMAESAVKKLLKEIGGPLKEVRHDLEHMAEADAEQLHELDGLLAIINAHEIETGMIPKPPVKKRPKKKSGPL